MSPIEELSFEDVYEANFRAIYNYAFYRVRDIATADDLTAQIFERALKHFGRYRPERAPVAVWLWAIARRVVQSHFARQRLIRWLPLDLFGDHSMGHSPETVVLERMDQQELIAAFATLSAREQDLVALKFVGGLTNRQIAAIAGLSESNVGTIVSRALHRLRRILAGPIHGDIYVEPTLPQQSRR